MAKKANPKRLKSTRKSGRRAKGKPAKLDVVINELETQIVLLRDELRANRTRKGRPFTEEQRLEATDSLTALKQSFALVDCVQGYFPYGD